MGGVLAEDDCFCLELIREFSVDIMSRNEIVGVPPVFPHGVPDVLGPPSLFTEFCAANF